MNKRYICNILLLGSPTCFGPVMVMDTGKAVERFVEALHYKPEGRGFGSQ